MEKTVWAAGWDGDWFRRAYDDFGHVLGSKENTEGKIFIEPQGICVMAGLGVENGNAIRALDSVGEHLATPHGIVLQQPAFSQYYLHLGEISSYPPGYKENAGVFCHTNPWIMIAETIVGRGDKAFDYYTRINPSAREEISELHKCEPYVYAQMIAGKDAANSRRSKELLAHRNCRMELCCHHTIHSRHSTHVGWPASQTCHAVSLERLRSGTQLPGSPLRDLRQRRGLEIKSRSKWMAIPSMGPSSHCQEKIQRL